MASSTNTSCSDIEAPRPTSEGTLHGQEDPTEEGATRAIGYRLNARVLPFRERVE